MNPADPAGVPQNVGLDAAMFGGPSGTTMPPPAQAMRPGPFPKTAEQLAYERGQQDMLRRVRTPRMTGYRIACGICWAVWTVLLAVGGIASFGSSNVGAGLLSLALAGLAGWYDYRIWTLKARRLTFLIIF